MQPEQRRRLGYVVQDARMCLRFMRQGHLDQAMGRLLQAWSGLSMEAGFTSADVTPERRARCHRLQPILFRIKEDLLGAIRRLQWTLEDEGRAARRVGTC